MWDDWDDFDNYFKRIQDIINSGFSGGYRPYRSETHRDYGSAEEGVIYASRDLEILDFDGYITITMELRGVMDEDLEVKPEENSVIISYMYDGIWRKKPLKLPMKINPKTAIISFNNCILDIELEKVDNGNSDNGSRKGEQIKTPDK